MGGSIDRCMDARMDEWVCGWMDGCKCLAGFTDGCVVGWADAWMDRLMGRCMGGNMDGSVDGVRRTDRWAVVWVGA